MGTDKMWAKPIFPSPVGPSEIPLRLGHGFGWNNIGDKTSGAAVCQLCGKNHPKPGPDLGESITLMRFLGLQGVEECCGRAADVLYGEFGQTFVEVFLGEFAANPDDPRFSFFRQLLPQILQEAQEKLRKCSGEVEQAQSEMEQLRIATQESRTRKE